MSSWKPPHPDSAWEKLSAELSAARGAARIADSEMLSASGTPRAEETIVAAEIAKKKLMAAEAAIAEYEKRLKGAPK